MKKLFIATACCLLMMTAFSSCSSEDTVTVTGKVDRSTLTASEAKTYTEEKGTTLIFVKDKDGKTTKEYIEDSKLKGKTFPYDTKRETEWCGCKTIE